MEVDREERVKGRLEVRPKAGRMKAIVQLCQAALDQQALEPAVAAVSSGRLQFANAAACGRVRGSSLQCFQATSGREGRKQISQLGSE